MTQERKPNKARQSPELFHILVILAFDLAADVETEGHLDEADDDEYGDNTT